jgi:hypothetical protein
MALTFWRLAAPATNSGGGRRVDKVCRHAGKVVRRLGKGLWSYCVYTPKRRV